MKKSIINVTNNTKKARYPKNYINNNKMSKLIALIKVAVLNKATAGQVETTDPKTVQI